MCFFNNCHLSKMSSESTSARGVYCGLTNFIIIKIWKDKGENHVGFRGSNVCRSKTKGNELFEKMPTGLLLKIKYSLELFKENSAWKEAI